MEQDIESNYLSKSAQWEQIIYQHFGDQGTLLSLLSSSEGLLEKKVALSGPLTERLNGGLTSTRLSFSSALAMECFEFPRWGFSIEYLAERFHFHDRRTHSLVCEGLFAVRANSFFSPFSVSKNGP